MKQLQKTKKGLPRKSEIFSQIQHTGKSDFQSLRGTTAKTGDEAIQRNKNRLLRFSQSSQRQLVDIRFMYLPPKQSTK